MKDVLSVVNYKETLGLDEENYDWLEISGDKYVLTKPFVLKFSDKLNHFMLGRFHPELPPCFLLEIYRK